MNSQFVTEAQSETVSLKKHIQRISDLLKASELLYKAVLRTNNRILDVVFEYEESKLTAEEAMTRIVAISNGKHGE